MTSNFDVNNFSSHHKSHKRPMFFSHAFPCVYILAHDLRTFGSIHFYGGSCWLYKMMHQNNSYQNNIILTHSSWSFKQKHILKIDIIKFYSLGFFFFKHKTAYYNGTMITLFVFRNIKIEHPYIFQYIISALNFWDQSLLRSLQRTKWEQKAMKIASFCQFKHHFMREM